jgi:hypothetical protein
LDIPYKYAVVYSAKLLDSGNKVIEDIAVVSDHNPATKLENASVAFVSLTPSTEIDL